MLARDGSGPELCCDRVEARGNDQAWPLINSQNSPKQPPVQVAIRAELIGDNSCVCTYGTTRGTTPVLAMCRQLLAAGLDPDRALEICRGATLALRIRSIAEAAALEIAGDGIGFRPRRKPDAASLARKLNAST